MLELIFRLEKKSDFREVEELTREAFWNHYSPGCDEHYLAHILRDSDAFIKELAIVAIIEEEIAANIMYTHAKIICDDNRIIPVLTFGPLSVHPKYQGKGMGSALTQYSQKAAAKMGHQAILIYGDPAFYSKVGFVSAQSYGIGTADNMYAPTLQAYELVKGALSDCKGRFVEDSVFETDPPAAEEFDKQFPPKKRLEGFPSQERFAELIKLRYPR